jgi:hypothetical protein
MNRDTRTIAMVLCAVAMIAFAAPLFGGATFVGRDHLTHTIPAKQHIADALGGGDVPEWWDAVDLGVPFAANPNHSALYPPTWIVAALPMPWSADFLLIMHVLLAGLGCAALARSLGAGVTGAIVAGAAFMLGGFVSSTLVHGGPLLTIAWAPWIAWAANRLAAASETRQRVRRTLALAAFVGCELLAGDPSFAIVGGMLAIAIVACRAERRLPALAATMAAHVVGALLAAVVILPALLLASHSARAHGIAHDAAVAWSMHPARILEWVWPDALGDPNQETLHLARAVADSSWPLKLSPSWALSLYVSLPVVVLAAIAWVRGDRRLRTFAIVVAAFIVLALGRYTPLYELYRLVFPPERFVRYPEKYIAGATLLVCAAAGVGWTSLAERVPSRRMVWVACGAAGALAALVLIGELGHTRISTAIDVSALAPPLDVRAAVGYALDRGLGALAVVLAMLAIVYLARRRPVLLPTAAVVLVGHLIARSWSVLPTFDRAVLAQPPLIVRPLIGTTAYRLARETQHRLRPEDSVSARARTLYEGAAANTAARFGLAYLVGYDQGHSARFETYRPRIDAAGARALDLYGVDHRIVLADQVDPAAVLATDAPYGPYALVPNPTARPRAFVASRWQWFASDTELAAVLLPEGVRDIDRETLATAHLIGTGDPAPAGDATTEISPCAVVSPHAEDVRVTCDSHTGGYAVLLDTWAAGWSATVDGSPAAIVRAEGLARAVRVTAGRHTVEFRYATPGLRVGALISLLSLAALLAGAIALRPRASRLEKESDDPVAK